MLNYETILSSYDDKLTLMEWLKKVEAALNDASLTSISLSYPSATSVIVTLNFADGTSVSSDEIPLNPASAEEIKNNLSSDGTISISLVGGKVRLSLSDPLSYAGTANLNDVNVGGDLSVQGDVEIGQGTETLSLHGGASIQRDLDVGGDLSVSGNISNTTGTAALHSVEIDGGLIVGEDATTTFGGDVQVDGLLDARGGASFNDDVEIGNNALLRATGDIEGEANASIDGDLDVGGDLSVEGAITGGSIIENMSGYAFAAISVTDTPIVYNYVGIVKNGNKLTIVADASITIAATTPWNANAWRFTIPAAVGNQLVPVDGVIMYGILHLYTSVSSSAPKQVGSVLWKEDATHLRLQLLGISPDAGQTTAGTTYRCRYEATFLLSENLAQ